MEISRSRGGVRVDGEVRIPLIWTKPMAALVFVHSGLTSHRSWTARVQARKDRENKAREEKAAKSDGAGEGTLSRATGV